MNDLLTPALDDAEPIAAAELDPPLCERCSTPFAPRKGTGGKPQRFCSEECRRQSHATAPTPSPGVGGLAPEAIQQPPKQTPIHEPPDPDEFNWATDDSVVLKEQPATAIYFNSRGQLVIRQERSWDRDEDSFIYFAPGNTQEFLDKLCDALGIQTMGA